MNQFLNIPEYKGAAVYCIENTRNHKRYIGCTMNLKRRIKNHISMLKTNRHNSECMQNDYNQGDLFTVSILYKSNIEDERKRKLDIRIKEYHLITDNNTISEGYNNKVFRVVAETQMKNQANESIETIKHTPKEIYLYVLRKKKITLEEREKIIEIAKKKNFGINDISKIFDVIGYDFEITFKEK